MIFSIFTPDPRRFFFVPGTGGRGVCTFGEPWQNDPPPLVWNEPVRPSGQKPKCFLLKNIYINRLFLMKSLLKTCSQDRELLHIIKIGNQEREL